MKSAPTSRIGVVILAAGKGTRMQSNLPKVMHQLNERPLIDHLVSHVEEAHVCERPVVVVAPDSHHVQDYLGDRAEYVVQPKQRGTGDAVRVTEPTLRGTVDHLVVLYGDMPFLSAASIQTLVETHLEQRNALTFLSATTPDFNEWRSVFYAFGRVVRDANGDLRRVVELKDATDEEKDIRELCTCYFCFDAAWLWEHTQQLANDNAQGEYYLVDLVQMAIDEGQRVGTAPVPLEEAVGINSKQDFDAIYTSSLNVI